MSHLHGELILLYQVRTQLGILIKVIHPKSSGQVFFNPIIEKNYRNNFQHPQRIYTFLQWEICWNRVERQ